MLTMGIIEEEEQNEAHKEKEKLRAEKAERWQKMDDDERWTWSEDERRFWARDTVNGGKMWSTEKW